MDDILLELTKEFTEILSINNSVTLPDMDDDGQCFARMRRG